ncbi:cortactin [Sarotherodon galilaeus]
MYSNFVFENNRHHKRMEPDEYKILVAYKLKGEYPALFTKKEKFLLRRKAAIYDIEGEQLFYWRYKGTDKTIKTTVSVSQCALCQASAATIKKPAEYIPIKLNKRVCGLLKIKRSLCSPYHPQTNGLVEKMNGTIQRALCKVVGDHPEMWDEYLDAVMFGIRTKKQVTTKYSPYYLMFGREARYPSEIPEEFMVDESVEDIVGQEELSEDIQKHQKLLELVKDNVVKAQEKTKGKIKMMKRDVVFKVGDKVLRANIRSQQRKGGKLEANFLGPYIITAIQGKSADLQDSNGTIIPKVNIDQLKLSKDSMPRVPHRGLKKTAATLLTAQPGPAAPQAAAAPASALAPKTTAAPVAVAPPPPRATQATAPMASLASLPVQTQHPSPVPQGIATTVSDPESGATAQKENEPPEPATNIMDARAGKSPHVLLSKIGSINAYLAIMVRQCNHHNSAKAAFIDSFSMTAIWKRKAPRLKIKPMEHEVILGIVIYPQEKKLLYLDPLGETKQGIQICLESTRAFMRKKGCNVSRWTCDTVKHPKQVDTASCGVFALKFAEKILRKESIDFPSTKKAINAHRLQIATTLLLETDSV